MKKSAWETSKQVKVRVIWAIKRKNLSICGPVGEFWQRYSMVKTYM